MPPIKSVRSAWRNHFIELQTDDQGENWHHAAFRVSNLGFKICHYFNDLAKEVNKQEQSPVTPEWGFWPVFPRK